MMRLTSASVHERSLYKLILENKRPVLSTNKGGLRERGGGGLRILS